MSVTTPSRNRCANAVACGIGWLMAAAVALAATGAAGEVAANASSEEHETALVALALAYEHGEGVQKDLARAFALYCEAARGGDPEAQFGLGWMYANGRGVQRDEATAASLFAMAAEGGHEAARHVLKLFSDARGDIPECMRPQEPDTSEVAAGPAGLDPFSNLPAEKQEIVKFVSALAPSYAVAPRLALAVIAVESNFDPMARSPKDARGLMQLIPETASRFSVKNVFDIRDNVRGGLAYLRWLLSYYRGQVALAAAAYNAGEGVVDKYRGVPPYPETRSYVQRILALFGSERHPYDPALATPPAFVAPW